MSLFLFVLKQERSRQKRRTRGSDCKNVLKIKQLMRLSFVMKNTNKKKESEEKKSTSTENDYYKLDVNKKM